MEKSFQTETHYKTIPNQAQLGQLERRLQFHPSTAPNPQVLTQAQMVANYQGKRLIAQRLREPAAQEIVVEFLQGSVGRQLRMLDMLGANLGGYEVWAEMPNGKTIDMLQISDWDFNWQDTYHYKQPFVLPKGTVVQAEWSWENTADNPRNPNSPPKLILWGEGSTDEMSGLIIGGITVDSKDEGPMWIPVILHYLEIERKAIEAGKKWKAIEATK